MCKEYPEHWDWFVKKRARSMNEFWNLLRKQCAEHNHAIYFVRYEDLVRSPKEALMGLMCFLLDERDLSGTNAERVIDQVTAKGS